MIAAAGWKAFLRIQTLRFWTAAARKNFSPGQEVFLADYFPGNILGLACRILEPGKVLVLAV
ncbi:TPA: hypothetical protein HA338_10760 [Methanosarcina acetivorans]|uniref:Uncharacterized protein n=1 Tax=Methanosarcina acetivorans TaxID=2214 RepID=A0A832SK16_9EURY|nr:hypothetical protein [Methanosarcina acetivorans]HIH94477.1 hypothetical protein [Methanosarcina acetivorans]